MNKIMEVRELSKIYKNGRGVFDINFDLFEGEIVGLLGPNGSGKTTIMKSITGLLIPQSGTVNVNGYNLETDFEDAIKNVGSLVEVPSAIDYMTAYDNLKMISRYYPEINCKRIDEVLALVKLEEFKNDRVKTFSLGMKQRLGIGIALYQNPKVIILDEPANGLDIEGTHELRLIIENLSREFMVTFFISSHLVHEIELICNRILIIKNGKLLDNCQIDEIKNRGIVLEDYFIDKVRKGAEK